MRIVKIFLFFIFVLFGVALSAQNNEILSSPDNNLIVRFSVEGGVMKWNIDYKNKPVICPSRLGITGYSDKINIVSVTNTSKDTLWTPVYGERAQVRDRYNAKCITVKRENKGFPMIVELRAYNEGIALRYNFPEEGRRQYISIKSEDTRFVVPEGTKAWFTGWAQGPYRLVSLSEFSGEAERPLTLELPNGLFSCLAEAEMVNYARTKFMVDKAEPNTIICSQYDTVDEIAPLATPWRVVMVGEEPKDLLQNNDIILNLNPPCALDQTWWIQPGKIMREVTFRMDKTKELIDFAAKHNIKYIHYDAGWYGHEYEMAPKADKVDVDPRRCKESDLDIKQVVDYARKKGVGVFLYVNQRALLKDLDELLPLYKKWGISGLKFGFVQVGSHRWTSWLHDAVKKCAKYELMVDIHDEYRPTGFSRTYPNLLTQEGIRGNEEFPDATTNTILPYTRFVAGAADYTICYYHRPETKPELLELKKTIPNLRYLTNTPAHQLALSVIFYSPLQFMYWYDIPDNCQNEPETEFFDALPTVWEDSKIISGRPGESVLLARKSGKEWFVGGITNNESRTMNITFDFLDEGKKYVAYVYTDGDKNIPTRTKVKVEKRTIKKGQELKYTLKAAGGVAIRLVQIEK